MCPLVSIDLSEAQSRKPVPDDQYSASVKEINGPHKGPKSHYLTFIIEIAEGEHKGRTFFHNVPINGAGAGIFADLLSKLTGEEYDVDNLENLEVNTDDLVGAPLGIITKQSEYPEGSGEMRSEIKKILSAR